MTEHKALSAFEQAKLQEEAKALNLRVARLVGVLDAIFDACGYVEDGSCQTVQIFQDDATRDWVFTAGKKSIVANSKSQLIRRVVNTYRPDLCQQKEN